MKYPKRYREFDKQNISLPSLKDNISKYPIEHKNTILSYLKKDAFIKAASPGISCDVISGDHISRDCLLYSDGVFTWDYRDVYYFEKYNLDLGIEFIKHILEIVEE